jgi:hypothetical protein
MSLMPSQSTTARRPRCLRIAKHKKKQTSKQADKLTNKPTSKQTTQIKQIHKQLAISACAPWIQGIDPNEQL